MTESPAPPATAFHDLEAYLDLPRTQALEVSPDGTRVVTTVSALSADRARFTTALWEVDPAGERPDRRLTGPAGGSGGGESGAAFLPDGSLLFVAARPDPEADGTGANDPVPALWLLPAAGGEARRVAAPGGGVTGVTVAAGGTAVIVAADVLPGDDGRDDPARRDDRRARGTSAILHTAPPIRYWDHDLGPEETHLFLLRPGADGAWSGPADLTPGAGQALFDHEVAVSDDGGTVVTTWWEQQGGNRIAAAIRILDPESGEARTLLPGGDGYSYGSPAVSPDGSRVACVRETVGTYDAAPAMHLVVVPAAGGEPALLAPDLDQWPREPVWTPDGAAVLAVVDEDGRAPIVRIDAATGAVARLTGDAAAYSAPRPSRDGRHVYALRGSVGEPAAPVRLDATTTGQVPERLGSGSPPALPGTLTEVEATADDGQRVRGWLALPHDAGETPAPLVLNVHGGPYASTNDWSWRWNPWLWVARGYAVLQPDPSLSTGYGQAFLERGHAAWGSRTYDDLMGVVDAVVARPDVDGTRTAAVGGSYGGYLVNVIATRTDRFRALVSHAGNFGIESFGHTTDVPGEWFDFFGDPVRQPARYERESPDRHAAGIRTPMLLIHGDRDYRCPIGGAQRLWWELLERGVDARFLLFPDEGHWILKPGNVVAWYETVLAFLDREVLGEPWRRPHRL